MKGSASRVRAVFKREWNSYFHSPVAYVFMMIFLALIAFFTFAVSGFYEAGQADLRSFFTWHPWLYLLLIPAAAMRLWSEERRSGTLELLLTLPLTVTDAILGKFLAAWLFLLLSLALTFPVVLTVFYLGSPDPGPIATGYLASALLAGAYLAVGCFTSALTRNQVISFILSVVVGLFLILAGYPPVTDLLSKVASARVVEGIAALGFIPHFETLQRGVVEGGDLAYFAAVMAAMLLATGIILRNRARK
ncbi:MAG: ABC transporter permease [Kiritimatiellia bacterium]|nr:ABC transporter permease [Kiritimatiellia bacterium]